MAKIPNTQTGMLVGDEVGTNDILSVPAIDPALPTPQYFFGDAYEMFDNARGGHDVLIGVSGAVTRKVECGDAFMMYGNSRGGNDLIIGGDGGSNSPCGDACDMNDYSRGGNDILIGGFNASNTLIGDARNMYGHSRGGNDLLIAGNSAATNNMYGDARLNMKDFAVCGNDTLISGSAADNMWGDSGTITGNNVTTGRDVFVFLQGNNTDKIYDFRQVDHDRMNVGAYGFDDISDLNISLVGSDTVINFGGGNSVTLVGFADPLHASDFIF